MKLLNEYDIEKLMKLKATLETLGYYVFIEWNGEHNAPYYIGACESAEDDAIAYFTEHDSIQEIRENLTKLLNIK